MEAFQAAGVREWVALPTITLLDMGNALPAQPDDWARDPTTRVGESIAEAALSPQAVGEPDGLNRITFLIPNGWDADQGTAICDPANPADYWYGRLIATADDWHITLDRRRDTNKDFFKTLRTSNASAVTHVGELRRTDDQPFNADDAKPVLDALRLALTIATGRTIHLLLPVGWQADTPVWTRWTSPHIDGVKNVGTFLDRHEGIGQLRGLIERVLTYCTTPERTDAIRYATSYYVTATYDVDVELGVALPVSGLQSLAYYRFVEQRQTHTKAQWSALPNTEAEIRLLLDDCKIPTALPTSLAHLTAISVALHNPAGSEPPLDALGCVIRLRNKIIHPTNVKPHTWTPYEWAETGYYAKYALLLAILNEVGYQGQHRSPLNPNVWEGVTDPVPWAPPPPAPTAQT